MQVSTLVEPVAGRGFRAMTGSPFEITVEAETRQEAIRQLQVSLRQRMAHGAEIVNVEAEVDVHPWQKFAGGLKDHPLLEQWEQAMAEYREQVDREQEAREQAEQEADPS
ncbi:MAG: hypothetical protein ACKV2Q_14080 [Planctomycetaceae bacterium]